MPHWVVGGRPNATPLTRLFLSCPAWLLSLLVGWAGGAKLCVPPSVPPPPQTMRAPRRRGSGSASRLSRKRSCRCRGGSCAQLCSHERCAVPEGSCAPAGWLVGQPCICEHDRLLRAQRCLLSARALCHSSPAAAGRHAPRPAAHGQHSAGGEACKDRMRSLFAAKVCSVQQLRQLPRCALHPPP